jgi:enediyne polyketide synthase
VSKRIAIVGIACRYPDANSPSELWENVLAGRRAFRRLPEERMRLEDYYSPDPAAPDRFYAQKAAVIEGYEFDRVGYRIAGSTYRATDLTHWLALDTAAAALADAGFPAGEGLPTASTGVVVGNSLTGEFTRANLMRLRWPYVRRTVGAALREHGWDDGELAQFLHGLESRYKSAFPPIDEDTLAGGLSNTIAGRICNQFDFKGGGFTVDGACSSSLLSVGTACNALSNGQIDAAVVGGVDLSIDPFEIIGFAKTGALASREMRVYDRHSNGFWPGEGCGMLVLLRQEDADERGLRSYATIAGWAFSSDGKGGITRPEAEGHKLAIRRAYEIAGFDIASVAYLEGHGTGTAVGDATELKAFSEARREARDDAPAAAISTVKGNIGHTKAAAGVAGLIKATLAVHHQIIPPATGHIDTHPELAGERPALRVPQTAELWPQGQPVRAAVSSMGFGGINAHVVVESSGGSRRRSLDVRTRNVVSSRQDRELLLLDAASTVELRGRVAQLAEFSSRLAFAELADLAATLQQELRGGPVRAAVVAGSPEQAERGFAKLLAMLDSGTRTALDLSEGVFLGSAKTAPRIGYLFPGQGSGKRSDGGALARRFEAVRELYRTAALPADGDQIATAVAQPRIVTSSVAGLRVLALLGIEAAAAAGHSLGELTSLHWGGAMDEPALLRLAAERGRVMGEASDGDGTMASVAAAPDAVEPLLANEPVVIAGYNGPNQTVVSGPVKAVERVCARAAGQGLQTTKLPVSHAFHSPAVAPAAAGLDSYLSGEQFGHLARQVYSTVTGGALPDDADLRNLLVTQLTEPVRFTDAVSRMAAGVDLLLEVGPGRVLSGLASAVAADVPVIPLDTDGVSLSGVLSAVAAAYALGAPVRHDQLFRDRFTKPLPLDKEFRFFASPCESVPTDYVAPEADVTLAGEQPGDAGDTSAGGRTAGPGQGSLEILRRLAAERAELPLDAVRPDTQPLDELHLSSITVGQIVNHAARELGVSAPMAASSFATLTLAELAEALDDLASAGQAGDDDAQRQPDGVAPWVRAFATELVPQPAPRRAVTAADGQWQVFAPEGHPLAEPLGHALKAAMLGDGVLLCLPADCGERHVALMLDAAHAALAAGGGQGRFVVVQDERGAAGLAKTLHLEAPTVATCVVTLPLPGGTATAADAETVGKIVADVAATTGFTEVHYDQAGTRRVPVLRPVTDLPDNRELDGQLPLGRGDVLLVTGGGKGITAECALALARDTGAAVALTGRSDPATDGELAANLDRMEAAGVTYRYVQADVTSAADMKTAVEEIGATLGQVTAVLHGAGRNVPVPLASLSETSFKQTLGPKIGGLAATLAATDPAALKLLITFGSIIGRAGLRGQADYATANDWLTDETRRYQEAHPQCRCLALEWSVWSGAGMGERLGVLESLTREGITPIPVDDGIALLRQVLASPDTPTALVVMGRAGGLPTITLEHRELPLARFIDQPRVYYPGIELVADAELSARSDPYLADHLLDGELLFPAVLGIEAMSQVGAALTQQQDTAVFEDMEFLRPIVIPPEGSTTIRVAALNLGDRVEAVIRSSDTAFQADHFRATLRYSRPSLADGGKPQLADDTLHVPLDPAQDLYGGGILFQGDRFQRVLGYRHLAAKSCVVEISNVSNHAWFDTFLPADLVAGDPGTRDAFMHAIQCCVPNATLLPGAVERLWLAQPGQTPDRVVLYARERFRDGDAYTYDLDIRDTGGRLLERWEGLRLHAVRKTDGSGPWVPALLGPYLERQIEELVAHAPRCVVHPDGEDGAEGVSARRTQTTVAVSRLLGRPAVVRHRSDGKPEVDEDVTISASHKAGVTLAVAGAARVGCDAERVDDRPADDWQALLGAEHLALAELVCRERGETLSMAATRVWGAIECLSKIGRTAAGPITLAEARADGWVLLRAGQAQIATFPARLRDETNPVVFTILTEGSS